MEKICKICNELKPIEQFHIAKNSGGYVYRKGFCIECERAKNREYYPKRNKEYEKNRHQKFNETHADYHKGYYHEHKILKPIVTKVCPVCGKLFETNQPNKIKCNKRCLPLTDYRELRAYVSTLTKEEIKVHRRERYRDRYKDRTEYDKARIKEQRKKYKYEHIIEHRARKQSYQKKRMALDVDYKLKVTITNKIRQSIKGSKQYEHSVDLLGCSIIEIRKHIEKQFKEGMTWDNWGVFGWHIDHIIPIASFDFTKKEDQYRCFHYTNLQPLWWYDNVMKRDKIIEKQLILL